MGFIKATFLGAIIAKLSYFKKLKKEKMRLTFPQIFLLPRLDSSVKLRLLLMLKEV